MADVRYFDADQHRLVKTLEDLIEQARAGGIKSIVISATGQVPDDAEEPAVFTAVVLTPQCSLYQQIGAVECLKQELVGRDERVQDTVRGDV